MGHEFNPQHVTFADSYPPAYGCIQGRDCPRSAMAHDAEFTRLPGTHNRQRTRRDMNRLVAAAATSRLARVTEKERLAVTAGLAGNEGRRTSAGVSVGSSACRVARQRADVHV